MFYVKFQQKMLKEPQYKESIVLQMHYSKAQDILETNGLFVAETYLIDLVQWWTVLIEEKNRPKQ